MSRRLLLVAMLVSAVAAWGGSPYCMRYVKSHLLYQRGGDTSVIDIDLEWPEYVDGSAARPLQQVLAKTLFGSETASLDSAYAAFLGRFGTEVTKPFATIPDDGRFCYVTCKLRLLGHSMGNYISFRAEYVCSPQPRSQQQGDTLTALLTYDIARGQVLRAADLLRMGRLRDGYFDESLVTRLLAGAGAPELGQLYSLQIDDACIADGGVLAQMTAVTDQGVVPLWSWQEASQWGGVATKVARRLAEATPEVVATGSYELPKQIDGEVVYTHVASPPSFYFRGDSMMGYLSKNLRITERMLQGVKEGGKAIVAFVVNRDGRVGQLRVLSPVSPDIDREVVRTLRLMPAWLPGLCDKEAVSVWCKLPVSVKR